MTSALLGAVIREAWGTPILYGMPEGTTFNYWIDALDCITARLWTPWFPELSYATIPAPPLNDTREVMRAYDEALNRLRSDHFHRIFWPDLDDVSDTSSPIAYNPA